jgi:hypothetical protein
MRFLLSHELLRSIFATIRVSVSMKEHSGRLFGRLDVSRTEEDRPSMTLVVDTQDIVNVSPGHSLKIIVDQNLFDKFTYSLADRMLSVDFPVRALKKVQNSEYYTISE